jgi:hypothetical protein
MPRVPIDYSKTIIYRIVCKDPTITDCYVGSTTDFKSRKNTHKWSCNNIEIQEKYNMKIYQFIRDKGGWNNWDMIEIEKYNAIDKLDADKRERYWLEFYKATLNTNIPSRNKIERYIDNRDGILNYSKKRYEEHKEYITEQHRNYYYNNRDTVLERHKNYKKKHNPEILEKQQKYRDENREEINRKARETHHRKKELKLMGLEDMRITI